MPELPEVEVTRRGIAPRLLGARIDALRLGKPLRWPLGCSPARLAGAVIRGVDRRGKYLLLHLDRGLLLWHLGMSGSLGFAHDHAPPGPHDHADLVTDRGTLRLHDPRRFGAVVHVPSLDAPVARRLLGGLGVEPLGGEFTAQGLYQGLRGRRTPVKQILLAGEVVVGVGNIYACEALFRAGIRPTTPGRRIGPARAARLHEAIRAVLTEAVERGGSTLRDFTGADGQAGHYQRQALVYGRAGEPCRQCGAAVQVLRQGQRSTYFCAACQRP